MKSDLAYVYQIPVDKKFTLVDQDYCRSEGRDIVGVPNGRGSGALSSPRSSSRRVL